MFEWYYSLRIWWLKSKSDHLWHLSQDYLAQAAHVAEDASKVDDDIKRYEARRLMTRYGLRAIQQR